MPLVAVRWLKTVVARISSARGSCAFQPLQPALTISKSTAIQRRCCLAWNPLVGLGVLVWSVQLLITVSNIPSCRYVPLHKLVHNFDSNHTQTQSIHLCFGPLLLPSLCYSPFLVANVATSREIERALGLLSDCPTKKKKKPFWPFSIISIVSSFLVFFFISPVRLFSRKLLSFFLSPAQSKWVAKRLISPDHFTLRKERTVFCGFDYVWYCLAIVFV